MHGKACCHINVPTPDMSLIFLVTSRVPHIQDIPSYHHPRNINADQTMKIIPFSPIGLFSVFWLLLFDFLIKKTMYLPTWHPPTIILLTLHTFCKGKEAWICKHGMAGCQSRTPGTTLMLSFLMNSGKATIFCLQNTGVEKPKPKCETQLHLLTLDSSCSVFALVPSLPEKPMWISATENNANN